MDFVYDTVGDGRTLRVFTLVDDFTRASPGLLVDVAIGAERVTAFLDALGVLPSELVCDNGPEFTSQHFDQWAHSRGIQLQFIRPGKPVENAFIESFNGKFRDECLNESWFATLADARQQIESWRVEYNVDRPHSGLADRTPAEFAQAFFSTATSLNHPYDRYE
jgi:putative transposase